MLKEWFIWLNQCILIEGFLSGNDESMKKVKQLTRLTYLIVAAFCIFIGYKYINDIYLLKSDAIQENLQSTFTHLKNDLEFEVSNAKINLSVLEVIVLRRLTRQIPFRKKDFSTIMNPLISNRKNQFNIYFALNEEMSLKFFKKKGAAYTVSKNKDLLNTDQFNNPETFTTKIFYSNNYHSDPNEVWYHAGKRSHSFEVSDIYFDRNYMKVWMYSIVKGIYFKDQFVGVVGIDFYLDSFIKMMNETAQQMKGSLFLIDNNSKKIFTQTHSEITPNDLPNDLLEKITSKEVRNYQIKLAKDNKNYIINSFPLTSFRWTIISVTNTDQLYNDLQWNIIFLASLGLFILLINLAITNYIFKILNRTYLELLAKNQSKSIAKMTEGLCHEINNPLATISLSHSAIRRAVEGNHSVNELISKSENAVSRIEMLINKLRKISFPAEDMVMRYIPLKEIIEELKIIFSEEILRYNIKFSYHSHTDDIIYCDSLKLIQVFLALMENSIDEIKKQDNRWIRIDHELSHKKSIIKFSDSGPGIKDEINQRVFLPFFTTKTAEMKKGLGLSVAQRIVEHQGGELRLASDSKMTTFEIILPHKPTTL